MSKIDCSIILFDVKSRTREKAIQTLMKICYKKLITQSKDVTRVVLFNTKETRNELARRNDGYKHIYDCQSWLKYGPLVVTDYIESEIAAESSDDENANWLEALLVALDIFKDHAYDFKGIITWQLLILTDFSVSAPVEMDTTPLDEIIAIVNDFGVYLYVVGPETDFPSVTLKSLDDIYNWQRDVNFCDTKNDRLVMVKRIVTETNTTIACNFALGTELFMVYKQSAGRQPWIVPLSIGTKIKIPTQTVRAVEYGGSSSSKVNLTTGQRPQFIWTDAEDQTVEVNFENLKPGVSRHNRFVPIIDEAMFKCDGPRCFNILGFTESSTVPEYFMRGDGCYYVLPKDLGATADAFNTLVDGLAKLKKYAIVRRVYNNKNVPKIVVLVPKPNHQPKCFLLAQLPYSDDVIVDYNEESVEAVGPSTEPPNPALYEFLDSLDADGPKNTINVPLGVNLMSSIYLNKIVNMAADKNSGRTMNLHEVELDYLSLQSTPARNKLESIWPQREPVAGKNESAAGDDDDGSESDYD